MMIDFNSVIFIKLKDSENYNFNEGNNLSTDKPNINKAEVGDWWQLVHDTK